MPVVVDYSEGSTFTAPINLLDDEIVIESWSGGGAGGNGASGGGGGGSYAKKTLTIGQFTELTIFVGDAGTSQGAGGDSFVQDSTPTVLCRALGGGAPVPGTGGVADVGDTLHNGGDGGGPAEVGTTGGGGGGGADEAGAGSNGTAGDSGGAGGAAGGAEAGAGGAGGTGAGDGTAGSPYGGGGGGGGGSGGGANGGVGHVRITYEEVFWNAGDWVRGSSDDGDFDDSSDFDNSSATLQIGDDGGPGPVHRAFLRFDLSDPEIGAALESGDTIATAILRVRAPAGITAIEITAHCCDEDASAAMTDWADADGRALTTASTTDDYTAGANVLFDIDIAAPLQEVVSRGGFTGVVQIILSSPDATFELASQENGDPGGPPAILLTLAEAGGGGGVVLDQNMMTGGLLNLSGGLE